MWAHVAVDSDALREILQTWSRMQTAGVPKVVSDSSPENPVAVRSYRGGAEIELRNETIELAIQSARSLTDRLLPSQTLFGTRRLRTSTVTSGRSRLRRGSRARDEQRGPCQLDPAFDRQVARRFRLFVTIALEQKRSVLQNRLAFPEPMQVFQSARLVGKAETGRRKRCDPQASGQFSSERALGGKVGAAKLQGRERLV